MALLYMDGFDAGDFIQKGWTGNVPTSSTTTRFNTGRSAQLGGSTTVSRPITPSTSVYLGLAMYYTGQDYSPRCMLFQSDNGSINQINVKWINVTTLAVQLNAVTVATAAYPFALNTWYYFEVGVTVADAGGTCVVKINGTTVINYTGDTRNAGTTGMYDTFSLHFGGSNTAAIFDDLYICDGTGPAPYNTFLNEVRIYPLSPNAAGASTQFTPSAGANYTTVDELPYSSTDYVSSGTVGNRDTYALSDLPATVGTIYAVQNNVIAKKTDASNIAIKPAMVSGGTVYYGAATNLGGSDATLSDLRTADPATTAAWTATGVNSLEAGFEVA